MTGIGNKSHPLAAYAVLSAIVGLLLSAEVRAQSPAICIQAGIQNTLNSLDGLDAVQALEEGKAPLSDFFSETKRVNLRDGKTAIVTNYTDQSVSAFEEKVNAVLAARTNVLGFPMRDFQDWLNANYDGKIPLPDPYTMKQLLIKNRVTLNDFVDDVVNTFLKSTVKQRSPAKTAKLLGRFKEVFNFKRDPLHARAWRFAKKSGSWIAGGLAGFAGYTVNYQLQQPITAVINVPSAPVNDYMNRIANRHLNWLASKINDRFNQLDASHARQVKDTEKEMIGSADDLGKYNFKGMTRDQAKAVWDKFDKKFYDLSQRMGNLLNSDEQTGRDTWMTRHIQNQEGWATSIAGLRTNLAVLDIAKRQLTEEIAKDGGHPTQQQQAQLKEYDSNYEYNKKVLGLVLSDWLLNRFFYPEARNSKTSKLAYESIDEYMGFPEFSQDLKKEIIDVLKVSDKNLVPIGESIPNKPGGR